MQLRRAPIGPFLLLAATLLVPAGCSKKDSVTQPKTGPVANFSATPLSGSSPLDVDFINESTSGSSSIQSVLWEFGDGGTSASMNASHLYGSAGTYTVSLTVTTADGSDKRIRQDYIVVGSGPGTTPPNAAFTGNPTGGNAPLTVQFNSDASTQGSSPITAYAWDFGDGATSTAQNPSHTYAANGTYTVSLSVTTTVGTDTETKPGYINVSSAPVPPTADFSGTPTDGHAPLTVQFTDHSSPGSAAIDTHTWNFGDGGSSTAINPSHIYAVPGTYNVSLTVTSTAGSDTDTKNGYVTVNPPAVGPTAEFSGTPRTGAAPLDVQFTDLSIAGTSPIHAWSWDFGDGGSSTQQSPAHTYASPGSYDVALTVTTDDGQNTNTKTGYITPCVGPVTDFTADKTSGFAPLSVKFTDKSTGGPTTFSWNFGDGTTNATKDPSHTYSTPGTYTVSHTSGNACGSTTVTKTDLITVQDPCPNPEYRIVSATWDTRRDADGDHFYERSRLRWNADVTTGCTRSVFAQIYYRPTGTTGDWILKGASVCYSITGTNTGDLGSFQVSGLPQACYDFRIVLYECNGTTPVATLESGSDSDLVNQCFEP